MNPIENIHYAIGEIAFVIASADGKIQKEERQLFHDIVAAEIDKKDGDFDISDIIFQILDRDNLLDAESNYNAAINVLKINSHYLSPQLKATAISIAEKIAKAFPPVTDSEYKFLTRLKQDITPLKGDSIYYESK
jgi:uncharacterized tellurite resistance protein B-like protein